jgi:magnesium-dependent phosphatase 1
MASRLRLFGRDFAVLPRVMVFDVDYTLWPYWVDTHLSAPFKKGSDGSITDGKGRACVLFPEVQEILVTLHEHPDIQIALASRTGQPCVTAG